ncbi:MAG: uroporphyrinogen decarboxylase family protein [Victivallales bacterium]|nr:uroporphyrinogen decarboxylase family protein [Victivallales bacterium]
MHGQKLLDLYNAFPPDNQITFGPIPKPASNTVAPDGGYHELKTDDWGIEWEFRVFGIQGHPHRYPLASWADADKFVFPPFEITPEQKQKQLETKKEYLAFSCCWVSIFERLLALRPFDEVLMDVYTEEPALMRFLDRMVEYWEQVIAINLEAGTDVICFGDDWGMQTAPLVSPELFRKIFKPRYEKLIRPIRAACAKIQFHCCGQAGDIGNDLLDLGIDIYWPQIKLYENDVDFVKRSREARVTLLIHPDRQHLIPEGTPAQIDAAIQTYAGIYHELGGGGIFYIEIENDAPWENVKTLIEAVHRYR